MPSGKLLGLVRMDGTEEELLGDMEPPPRVCWSDPPDKDFTCPQTIMGQRLDGPLSFFHDGRLFVVARKHLEREPAQAHVALRADGLEGIDGGMASTSRSGVSYPARATRPTRASADVDTNRVLVTWYSGDLDKDESWIFGILDVTDIWQGTIDFSKLK